MRSQLAEHAIVALLGQCFRTPRCQVAGQLSRVAQISRLSRRGQYSSLEEQRRCYQGPARHVENGGPSDSSNVTFRAHRSNLEQSANKPPNNKETRHIAVIGSGITGLASAHYLARELPDARITIYESSSRVGGWLRTEHFGDGEGMVHLEQGPRTLRPGSSSAPAGLVTYELIQDLGLEDELLITPKSSPAAQNRFVYYPDHLVRMPGPPEDPITAIFRLWREPLFQGVPWALIKELISNRRPQSLEDESVGSFLNRRLDSSVVTDNIVSAVLHGIYAGNVYNLSVKSLLPSMWHLEATYGSILKGTFTLMSEKQRLMTHRDVQLTRDLLAKKLNPAFLKKMSQASVYTFKSGISALSAIMEDRLRANSNVTFRLNAPVESIEHDGENDIVTIKAKGDKSPSSFSNAISTIPARTLSILASSRLPSLASIHAVTVMVVNLFFAQPDLLPERGFGYLIPRSVPFDQNPERALGIIFDSDATVDQDTLVGTKVTVMLGGHWWDGWETYPSEEEGIAMARAVLKRHLKVDAEPVLTYAGLQKDCIPQYTVGHEARMSKTHADLSHHFGGKLAVAGNSYTGVGVNDCVRSARDVVMRLAQGEDTTGLEVFSQPPAWMHISADGPI